MRLLEQILKEAGADALKSVTFVPGECCYLKSVKSVNVCTPSVISVTAGKREIKVEGEGLRVDRYFEGDLFVRGDVKGVRVG